MSKLSKEVLGKRTCVLTSEPQPFLEFYMIGNPYESGFANTKMVSKGEVKDREPPEGFIYALVRWEIESNKNFSFNNYDQNLYLGKEELTRYLRPIGLPSNMKNGQEDTMWCALNSIISI